MSRTVNHDKLINIGMLELLKTYPEFNDAYIDLKVKSRTKKNYYDRLEVLKKINQKKVSIDIIKRPYSVINNDYALVLNRQGLAYIQALK